MDEQERRISKRRRAAPASDAGVRNDGPYIGYVKALRRLRERLNATPEELAAWITIGPERGGLAAYSAANDSTPPKEISLLYRNEHYLDAMMDCQFSEQDIEQFEPGDRFITGRALIERWSTVPGIRALPFIEKNIWDIGNDGEIRLLDLHPTWGVTRGSFPENSERPSVEEGLFSLAQIKEIEQDQFGYLVEQDHQEPEVGTKEWREQNAAKAANVRHNQPGGSRDKQQQIRDLWATGKYQTRDRCAEEECAALNMPFSTARKALRNTPEPGPA